MKKGSWNRGIIAAAINSLAVATFTTGQLRLFTSSGPADPNLGPEEYTEADFPGYVRGSAEPAGETDVHGDEVRIPLTPVFSQADSNITQAQLIRGWYVTNGTTVYAAALLASPVLIAEENDYLSFTPEIVLSVPADLTIPED